MDLLEKKTGKKINAEQLAWHILPVFALLLWGALCLTNNLWYDEAYSAALVEQPWFRMIYITAADAHSPFYYTLLEVFFRLLGGGTNFWILKLFSLMFMLGYMLLGKYYVNKLFGRQVSVWFMFFSLAAPAMSVQGGNVRMYSMALFFMMLAGLLAYDLFLHATRRKWQLLCLASICTVYCHTFAMIQIFLLYVLFLAALLYAGQREKIKSFFLCGGTVAVAFLPWLAVTVRQVILRMRYDIGAATERADFSTLMDYFREWFSALETPIDAIVYVGLALSVVLGISAILWMRTQRNFVPALGTAAFLITTLLGWLLSVFVNNCFLGRYVFPGFGFIMLLWAVGMCRIQKGLWKAVIAVAALACLIPQYRSELQLEYDDGLKVFEEFWEENVTEEDAVVGFSIHSLFLSVYHPELRYYLFGYEDYKMPFGNTEALLDFAQLDDVRGNIWYVTFGGYIPDGMEAYYDWEEALRFDYMYYDLVYFKMTRRF